MYKDISEHRKDFPILERKMHGSRLAFLDSAASAQKPVAVTHKMNELVTSGYSNIHRGLYLISQELTRDIEDIRSKVAGFLNASSEEEIVFTSNATDSINLLATSYGEGFLSEGDEIILTEMEHHANIVPWQILRDKNNINIKVLPINDKGELELERLEELLTPKTKLVSFVYVSNALGTINPAKEIINKVKAFSPEIVTAVDCSQAIVHMSIDVQDLGCDFAVFTGHKLYAPTGIGVLYGRKELLEKMPPYKGGGDMIETVSFDKTTYREAPYRFEAGTPPIIEIVGLGAAIDYVEAIGIENIAAHEDRLLKFGTDILSDVKGLRIIGTAENKAAILSFVIDGLHSADISMILDRCGVAIRAGHHCCMPLMKKLNVDSTCRASLALYSNEEDLIQLGEAVNKAVKMLIS